MRHVTVLLLLSALLPACVVAAGCGGGGGRKAGAANVDAAAEEREANGQKALKYAKNTNTVAAYQDIIKRFAGTEAAGIATLDLARLNGNLARAALGRKDLKAARQLAEEARQNGDTTIAHDADLTIKQIDHSVALAVERKVSTLLANAGSLEACSQALSVVAEALGETPSQGLVQETRKLTLEALSGCVTSALQAATQDGAYAAVRKALMDPSAKRALGNEKHEAFVSQLNDAVVAAMTTAVQGDLDARRWAQVFATLGQWQADGRAEQSQHDSAAQAARDVITKDLIARGAPAIGGTKPEPLLAEIDVVLKLLEPVGVAPDLTTLRAHLAVWIECKRLACVGVTKPSPAWNFGSASLLPPASTTAAALESIPTATKVWVLARGKGFLLVSKTEPAAPASWEQRIAAASGWIDAATLKTDDTTNWLPVGPALVGVRVWLPTGTKNDKTYQLGSVKSVEGDNVTVEKMSDGSTTTVARSVLRVGVLAVGQKVLAFCQGNQLGAGRIDQVVPHRSGPPSITVMCLTSDGKDEKAHEEVLGALRAMPETLPVRRP